MRRCPQPTKLPLQDKKEKEKKKKKEKEKIIMIIERTSEEIKALMKVRRSKVNVLRQ
jgi:hypothetical protein